MFLSISFQFPSETQKLNFHYMLHPTTSTFLLLLEKTDPNSAENMSLVVSAQTLCIKIVPPFAYNKLPVCIENTEGRTLHQPRCLDSYNISRKGRNI